MFAKKYLCMQVLIEYFSTGKTLLFPSTAYDDEFFNYFPHDGKRTSERARKKLSQLWLFYTSEVERREQKKERT